jgi:hypothetical protein
MNVVEQEFCEVAAELVFKAMPTSLNGSFTGT